MNGFDTKLKQYRFKAQFNANLFAAGLSGDCNAVVRRGLPQYNGQSESGWSVFIKAPSIAAEMSVDAQYKKIADNLKMEKI